MSDTLLLVLVPVAALAAWQARLIGLTGGQKSANRPITKHLKRAQRIEGFYGS